MKSGTAGTEALFSVSLILHSASSLQPPSSMSNTPPTERMMQDVMRRAHIHERVRWSSSHLSTSVELDRQIYRAFRDAFPQASVDVLKDSQLRGKPGWRFLESFRGRIADVDRLTILKRDVRRPLEQSNIDLVGRGVWLAVEVARRIEFGDPAVSV